MTGKTWLLAGVAVVLLCGPGCVCCGNQSYATAHERGADCDIPTCQRNQVYLFAVGGMNPAEMMSLELLREELTQQGFAKVAAGQTIHTVWMAQEMRDIRAHEPDAVFIILGTGSGATAAVRLAERTAAKGLPIAAVVLLGDDTRTPAPELGIRTVALSTGTGRFATSPSADTVAAVTQVLHEVAQSTPVPAVEHIAAWWYPNAPPARPFVAAGPEGDWAFLFDSPGTVPLAIAEGQPAVAANPGAPVYTSVVR
jgi:hypothetical protein